MNEEIKVWVQMFFTDGSVSQGYRISADVYDDEAKIEAVGDKILKDLNRDEGLLLIWGAGDIMCLYRYADKTTKQIISSSSSQVESETSASES